MCLYSVRSSTLRILRARSMYLQRAAAYCVLSGCTLDCTIWPPFCPSHPAIPFPDFPSQTGSKLSTPNRPSLRRRVKCRRLLQEGGRCDWFESQRRMSGGQRCISINAHHLPSSTWLQAPTEVTSGNAMSASVSVPVCLLCASSIRPSQPATTRWPTPPTPKWTKGGVPVWFRLVRSRNCPTARTAPHSSKAEFRPNNCAAPGGMFRHVVLIWC